MNIHKHVMTSALLAGSSMLAVLGCTSADPKTEVGNVDNGNEATLDARLALLQRDLGVGSQGDDVAAVHEYLKAFGYFPNDELQQRYPRWRSVTSAAPAVENVFDEHSAEAVRAFQAQMSLPATGQIDAATRVLLRTPRCGVPDGIPDEDPSEKFNINSHTVGSSLTWRFDGSLLPPNITTANARDAIGRMFAKWSAETNLTFRESSPGENIELKFSAPSNAGWAGLTSTPLDGTDDIRFNPRFPWRAGLPFPNELDLATVALHEIGHALGLGHSSIPGSSMFPMVQFGGTVDALHPDDKVAISYKYDKWTKNTLSTATDIGTGGNAAASTWIVTREAVGSDFKIKQWNGSSWVDDSAAGIATRIAVDPLGFPWVVQSSGLVWKRTTTDARTGTWGVVDAWAIDIAVGRTTWAVGGDGNIYELNGSTWETRITGGGARRIAVDSQNVPWFVWSNGDIFTIRNGQPFKLPGCALDIGAWNNVWITGCSSVTGGRSIYLWNEQPVQHQFASDPATGNPIPCNAGVCPSGLSCDRSIARCYLTGQDAPSRFNWIQKSGGALTISVGSKGPWIVNNAGSIYQQDKPGTAN